MNKSRPELIQSIVEKMGQIIRGTHVTRTFTIGELTLSRPQIGILFLISRSKEGMSVKNLADKVGVTPGAITQFIDALVAKGLVSREEDPIDRRVLRIKLTELATEQFSQFKKDYFKSISKLFDNISDAEMDQLSVILDKLAISNLEDN